MQVFACSYSYVFTLTIPNSILTYWAFPQEVSEFGNAFAVYPPSGLRTTAIILMIGHQMVAFLLFIMPVSRPVFSVGSAGPCRCVQDVCPPRPAAPPANAALCCMSPSGRADPIHFRIGPDHLLQVFYMWEKALRIHTKVRMAMNSLLECVYL